MGQNSSKTPAVSLVMDMVQVVRYCRSQRPVTGDKLGLLRKNLEKRCQYNIRGHKESYLVLRQVKRVNKGESTVLNSQANGEKSLE
jgi:hypothetical protein